MPVVADILEEAEEMSSRICEFDHELGVALTTTTGIIDLLEIGKQREAFREAGGLLDILKALCRLKVYSPEIPLPDNFERAMSQVMSAYTNQSWLLLGNVLRYEIEPILKDWKTLMRNQDGGLQ